MNKAQKYLLNNGLGELVVNNKQPYIYTSDVMLGFTKDLISEICISHAAYDALRKIHGAKGVELLESILSCIGNTETNYAETVDYIEKEVKRFLNETS